MAYGRLRHNLYLRDTPASLTVGRADAVGTRIAAADDEHILVLGRDALLLGKLHSGQHAVLLREQFESQVHTLEFASGSLQIAGNGST